MKNSISFDKYDRQEDILRKFKEQAAANADKNKEFLFPRRVVDSSYLDPSSAYKSKTTPVIDKKASFSLCQTPISCRKKGNNNHCGISQVSAGSSASRTASFLSKLGWRPAHNYSMKNSGWTVLRMDSKTSKPRRSKAMRVYLSGCLLLTKTIRVPAWRSRRKSLPLSSCKNAGSTH